MPDALLITAPLLVAAVLLVSAVGKLRAPSAAAAGFEALDVPRPLRADVVVRSHPWAEVAIGLLLVLVGGWPAVLAAAAALVLLLAYLALVARAVRRPVDITCSCFGAWGEGAVTRWTVVRNVWLVLLGVVALAGAVRDERAPLTRVADAGAGWWVVALAAAALTVALVTARSGPAAPAADAVPYAVPDESGDYLRSRTPAVPITFADGTTTTLRALSTARAQLLLFVSETCASCQDVIAAVPGWREAMPQVEVRMVLALAAEHSALASPDEPQTIHDVEGWIRDSVGTTHTPSAVLLGADGLLAGGPVTGAPEVTAFVRDVQQELSSVG